MEWGFWSQKATRRFIQYWVLLVLQGQISNEISIADVFLIQKKKTTLISTFNFSNIKSLSKLTCFIKSYRCLDHDRYKQSAKVHNKINVMWGRRFSVGMQISDYNRFNAIVKCCASFWAIHVCNTVINPILFKFHI